MVTVLDPARPGNKGLPVMLPEPLENNLKPSKPRPSNPKATGTVPTLKLRASKVHDPVKPLQHAWSLRDEDLPPKPGLTDRQEVQPSRNLNAGLPKHPKGAQVTGEVRVELPIKGFEEGDPGKVPREALLEGLSDFGQSLGIRPGKASSPRERGHHQRQKQLLLNLAIGSDAAKKADSQDDLANSKPQAATKRL